MILKKIKISYYSFDILKIKKEIEEILKNYGIFNLELIEDENEYAIIFYLPKNRFLDDKLNQINLDIQEIEKEFIFEIFTQDLDTNTYKDEWKKSFTTTKITDRITVNPSWLNYTKKNDDEIVINIDPSETFGTGAHSTTSLCIEMLEKYIDNQESLLDVGCGSGILMLAAKKLSVKNVTGIDIDKACFDTVNENFKINNLDLPKVHIGNLLDEINGRYDIIVSNILVDVLEKLLIDIKKVTKKDSILIFSGILKEKETRFLKKANEIGLNLIDKKEKDEWVALVFRGGAL